MHIITEKLTLSPRATLDLEAGAVLTAKSGAELQVLGTLNAALCVCTADGWKVMALAEHTHT